MAVTYRVKGYLVDASEDTPHPDWIDEALRGMDYIVNLRIDSSEPWEWEDDCPENFENPSKDDLEARFHDTIPTPVFGAPSECVTVENAVMHPSHYQGAHECLDEMIAMFGVDAVKDFCRCNIYKYRFRANQKNGDEDIKKAEAYATFLMNLEEGKPWNWGLTNP